MDKILQKFVEQKFATEAQAELIQKELLARNSVVISGHRSTGVRPFLANMMMFLKQNFKADKVAGMADLEKDCECYMIPGVEGIDFEVLIAEAMKREDKFLLTIKEPDFPLSILKLLKQVYKENGRHDKVYVLVDCDKADNVPFIEKITKISIDESGKIQKEVFEK